MARNMKFVAVGGGDRYKELRGPNRRREAEASAYTSLKKILGLEEVLNVNARKGPWRSVSKGQSLWLEIICSFMFLFASIWMAFDKRQVKALGSHSLNQHWNCVGAPSFVSTTLTSQKGYAGAGLNPARCLGPVLVRGGHLWDGHRVFWVRPAIASVAFTLYMKIIPHQHFSHL
ncbi:hypothetical protein QYF36_019213 [Acer negundo]|nr:hypothetical protein QYF36_019213 [Acer negundo]